MVFSSGAIIPARAPASMDMLQIVIRPSWRGSGEAAASLPSSPLTEPRHRPFLIYAEQGICVSMAINRVLFALRERAPGTEGNKTHQPSGARVQIIQ